MFGRSSFCGVCGIKVDKEADHQRFGKHFCSEDHANQCVQKMQEPAKLVKDSICGMRVDPRNAYHTEVGGRIYFFCGAGCKASFKNTHLKMTHKVAPKVGSAKGGGGGSCH